MGAGKSTVGRHLAEMTGYALFDSDNEIEKRCGADIPWIFDVEGEDGFRNREEAMISELCSMNQIVLATGGGAVMREANRATLKSSGAVVYLRASVREQVRRTSQDNKRPLLAGKDRKQVLTDLMATRDPLYKEVAHVTVQTDGKSARRIAEIVLEGLSELGLWENTPRKP